LHPPDVLLQVRAAGGQRVQAAVSAPSQVAAQVGLGMFDVDRHYQALRLEMMALFADIGIACG